VSWFKQHDGKIPRHGSAAVAFLSCLFPERRADRVYNVQEKRLEKIIGRILGLGTTRLNHLGSWRTANGADFAQTVQNVMREAEFVRPRPEHELTLEEIDALFDRIASNFAGSSPDLQARILEPLAADKALQLMLPRMQSHEAKWLMRMLLKRYEPIDLPEGFIMGQFHCLLPSVLRLQNCFTAAVRCLDDPALSHIPPRPSNAETEQAAKRTESGLSSCFEQIPSRASLLRTQPAQQLEELPTLLQVVVLLSAHEIRPLVRYSFASTRRN
jgi:DNA ligase 4